MERKPVIGFVGAGKVGQALGRYFGRSGLTVRGYCSRSLESAQKAAAVTGTAVLPLEELTAASDILFLTVPDGVIEEIWQTVRFLPLEGKVICHCSGLHSFRILTGIEETGGTGYSLHPLCAITGSFDDLAQVYFTLDHAEEHQAMNTLLAQIKNPVCRIEAAQKAKYHAAAVFCSNLVAGITHAGSRLFLECGLEAEFAQRAWRQLFLGNAQNIERLGPVQALTGPLERADDQTIHLHLEALDEPAREIYRLLSLELLAVAQAKNPGRNYLKVEELLKR
ncbi:MAG: DUF2520 domain-containing protein [Sporomusaceae bacterium]|jgi:predicted short-subunit dehydrogenase-like oxidoreductase (DUF2520 family)|nr:DUF2520 domain-containing protein [Sporomusaceae bacterium]